MNWIIESRNRKRKRNRKNRKNRKKKYFPLYSSTSFNDIDKIQNSCYNIIITSYIKKGLIPMNHCVKLICAACLSAMTFFSCSTHKDSTSSFPAFENLSLSAVQLTTDIDTTECSPIGSHSCLDYSFKNSQSCLDCSLVSSHSDSDYTECSPIGSHSECSLVSSHSDYIEEYFNLPSPVVDISKYKTVCEGDNPPLRGGNQSSDNPPLHGGNQSGKTDILPIQQFSITDEEIEILKYIVEQETRGGSYRHKCIVTNVVLNRVKDSRFPNTVKGVLLQKNQFSSTWNYYQKRNKPDDNTVNAINDVLNGKVKDESNGALYFHSMSNDGWFSSLCFVMELEGHRFFK